MDKTPTIADLVERNRLIAKDYKPLPYHWEPGYGKTPSLVKVVIHRNAGGNVRHALRDIIILDQVLGLKEIAIIHHTDCGTLRFTNEQVANLLKSRTDSQHWKEIDAMDFGAITDVEESVRENLEWLKTTPFVRKELIENTYGFVWDVKTGLITPV